MSKATIGNDVPPALATGPLRLGTGADWRKNSTSRLNLAYETILSTTDDFAYIFDPQGRFLYANTRLLKVWAKTLDQVIGKTCHDLGYPTWHADMHMREVEEVVRTKAPIRGEVPFTGDSGISGIYDYIFQPVLNDAGEVDVIVGTTRDVTERKQGEENLKAAQIELKKKAADLEAAAREMSFLGALTQKLSTVSDEHEINRIAAREIGHFLKADRCYFVHVLPEKDRVRVLPDWRENGLVSIAGDYALSQFGNPEWAQAYKRAPFSVNDVHTHPWTKDSTAAYDAIRLRAYAFAPFVLEGNWVACISVGSAEARAWTDEEKALLENAVARVWPLIERARVDGTLRETQRALREANDLLSGKASVLEAIVQQRTAKLSESIEELEAFSYSISHDMRAPLRAMRAFSAILSEEHAASLDDSGQELLHRINAASRRMDQLIQDVLSFSQVSRKEVTMSAIDPNKLIQELIRSYPNLDPATVDIECAKNLPPVKGNEALLTQCVSNVLDNAVKFTKPGLKPQVKIAAQVGAGRVHLTFTDNGIGISPQNLERIFEIFQRVGRDTPGTGIGLAIVKKAAEKMNGKAGVKSELGQGSEFWLDLPAA